MFLPIEGLFAEVVRQPELVALLQREYKIIVTGPTTLAAMLKQFEFVESLLKQFSEILRNILKGNKRKIPCNKDYKGF